MSYRGKSIRTVGIGDSRCQMQQPLPMGETEVQTTDSVNDLWETSSQHSSNSNFKRSSNSSGVPVRGTMFRNAAKAYRSSSNFAPFGSYVSPEEKSESPPSKSVTFKDSVFGLSANEVGRKVQERFGHNLVENTVEKVPKPKSSNSFKMKLSYAHGSKCTFHSDADGAYMIITSETEPIEIQML